MDTVKNINGLPCIETLGNPRELGEYFIAIDDIDQFLKRVVCAVAAQGAEYIFSPVAYGPPALAPGRDLGNHILLEMDEAPGDAFFPDGLPGTCFGPLKKRCNTRCKESGELRFTVGLRSRPHTSWISGT